jgi:short-subunit dehydrogenase
MLWSNWPPRSARLRSPPTSRSLTRWTGWSIDILVNNAGVGVIGPFEARTADEIANEVQVNLVAVLELTRQVLPGMLERDHGHVVFVSSLQASAPTPGFAVYGATKAALSHFAAILRLELVGTSVGTTLVAPGPVDPPMWDRVEASPFTTALLRRYSQAGLLTKGARRRRRCSRRGRPDRRGDAPTSTAPTAPTHD